MIEGEGTRKIGDDDTNVMERKLRHGDDNNAVAGESNAPPPPEPLGRLLKNSRMPRASSLEYMIGTKEHPFKGGSAAKCCSPRRATSLSKSGLVEKQAACLLIAFRQ